MSQSKTTCEHCQRPPGGVHKKRCARGKNHYRTARERKAPPKLSPGYPVADIFDCVGGPIKSVRLPRGEPARIQRRADEQASG